VKNIVHQTKSGMQFLQKEYQKDMINLNKHLYSLAAAASGYHKVLEENRKLYNQVQDLKGKLSCWRLSRLGILMLLSCLCFEWEWLDKLFACWQEILGCTVEFDRSWVANRVKIALSAAWRKEVCHSWYLPIPNLVKRERRYLTSIKCLVLLQHKVGHIIYIFTKIVLLIGMFSSSLLFVVFLQGKFSLIRSLWFVLFLMVTMFAYLHMARQDQEKHTLW